MFKRKNQTADETQFRRRRSLSPLRDDTNRATPYPLNANRIPGSRVGQTEKLSAVRRSEQNNHVPASRNDTSSGLKFRRWATLILLIFILGAVLFELNISASSALISIIQPPGYNYMPHSLANYQAAAAKAINSSIYNQNKLTINQSAIAADIIRVFPEIQSVSVRVPLFGSTPHLYLQLQQPALIVTAINTGNSYLADSSGVIVAPLQAISLKQAANLKAVQDPLLNQVIDGQQVLTPEDVQFILTVVTILQEKGVAINKMILTPAAEELDVYPTAQPYYVKFNLHQSDARQQTGTYLATLATLKQQNKPLPTQYIDVRVDGRAYYK